MLPWMVRGGRFSAPLPGKCVKFARDEFRCTCWVNEKGRFPDAAVPGERSCKGGRANRWHTDFSFVDAYASITILRAVVLPDRGGDTLWADTGAACKALPQPLKEFAERIWAVHSNEHDHADRFYVQSASSFRMRHRFVSSLVHGLSSLGCSGLRAYNEFPILT